MEDLLTHDRLIAFHRNQTNPEGNPPSTLTFAEGEFRYDKMTRELTGSDDILRTKVLIEINEDFKQGYNIVEGIRSELPRQLWRALTDPNDTIRELASRSFVSVARITEGREYLHINEMIVDIAALFDDLQENIRRNAYNCLLCLSQMRSGCEAVVEAGIIEILVDKMITEKSENILVLTLELIEELLEVEEGPRRALATPIISRTKKQLESVSSELRRLAAENLAAISFSYPGKKKVIEEDCVHLLTNLLFDDISEVRGGVLLALSSLSIENAAKIELIDGHLLERIMDLLGEKNSENTLSTIELISNVAEHPVAKVEFEACLDKLRDLSDGEDKIIASFAQKAMGVITWRPEVILLDTN